MNRCLHLLRRWAFSTTALTVIAGIGSFLGATAGVVLQLILFALIGSAGPALPVLLLCTAGGGLVSLGWGCRVLYQYRTVPL